MTRQPVLLDPFQGVGSGLRAVLNIPPGYRYHDLCLDYQSQQAGGTTTVMDAATLESEISKFELLIGNKPQRTATVEEIIMLRQFTGDTYRDNFLHVPFSEKDRNTIFGEEALAWGTGNLGNPAVQCRVTLASGIYSPSLTAFAERDNIVDSSGNPISIGAIVKWYELSFNVAASGSFTWTPDISRGDKIRRVHIKDNGHITQVDVYANNNNEYSASSSYNVERLTQAGFTPQSNWFHVAFDIDKGVLSNFDTVRPGPNGQPRLLQNASFKFNFNASGNYNVFLETIGPPD